MKFHIENLGLLDQADIELADLTIICGENNTGKTYAAYAIYGFLRSWREILYRIVEPEIDIYLKNDSNSQLNLEQIFSGKINKYLEIIGARYTRGLPRVFATDHSAFSKTIFKPSSTLKSDFSNTTYQHQVKSGPSGKVFATITKATNSPILEVLVTDVDQQKYAFNVFSKFIIDAIADIVFSPHIPSFHISSAERTGTAIFRKELDIARTRILNALNEIDSNELRQNPLQLLNKIKTEYPWPVEDNVEFVRQLETLDKHTGELATQHPEILKFFDSILGGSYKVIKQQLVFQEKGAGKKRFGMNESSSCIRALLDVGFYLRCKAKPGEIFIIDEPELNLHPKNQRAFARLVARLVNAGMKVFITTHSDYLVKELNTLIMLNQRTAHTRAVQQRHGYDDTELLAPERIRLYMTDTVLQDSPNGGRRNRIRTLTPATISPEHGIEVPTFDETIDTMNAIQEEIVFGEPL